MAIPKWTEERTEQLTEIVGTESPVSRATVANAADVLGTSTRSVASKLRKMDFEVELATQTPKGFTEDQETTLAAFVTDNSGEYTYAQIAEHFEGGTFSPKQIQGKILSMELTQHVKPAPKVEAVRKYTPEEEATFVRMVQDGAFVEQIAEAMGRPVNSIRGKALSMLRSGDIEAIPRQQNVKSAERADALGELGDISAMTVEEIAESIGKTVRGVKTMLTRRGLAASNYDGVAKREKAAAAA